MSERRKSPLVPLAIAGVAIVALLASLIGATRGDDSGDQSSAGSRSGAGQSQGSAAAPDDSWEQLARREVDDPTALGEVDAPVVMIAYSEYQCPFCGKFARDTEPTLIEKYVDDGTLRIEWRDFPYLGPESTTAAEGGRAAAAQDKFWAFQGEMFANQLPPNSGNLDADYLAAIAERVGLDVEQFRADMKSEATRQAIAEDFGEGQAIGVTGTPAFVINGVPVIGAQPIVVFEETIEQALEDAGR